LDAALAEGETTEAPAAAPEAEANEAGDDLDLENFGKKKRKKKKTGFNLDDLDAALPSTSGGDEVQEEPAAGGEEDGAIDDTFDFGMKKKKKKKPEINELLSDNKENEEVENGKRGQCLNRLHLQSQFHSTNMPKRSR
jgi:translation initiation factor 2 subunit 2